MNQDHDPAHHVRALVATRSVNGDGTRGWLQHLCSAAVEALAVSGVAVILNTKDGAHGIAAASAPSAAELEELQVTIGEGPSIEAYATRRPVLLRDLDASAQRRWPGFCPAARDRGVQAVFAFPLQVGAARLGVLNAHRRHTGALSAAQFRLALGFAEVAVQTVLDGQASASLGNLADGVDHALDSQVSLYQAQGMVMVDLGISIRDAAARLRAYAFSVSRPLHDVARDVVAGQLHLDRDDP